ncbi:MAG: DUF45 domain-containing protein [Clostridia bacterium]|nr:DUF45 domain-containing protein [Clostridia bacterium]
MKVQIEKSRRKTVVLKILDSENAVLKAPVFYSDKKLAQFLESKKEWLLKTVQKFKEKENFAKQFQFDKFVYQAGGVLMPTSELCKNFDELSEDAKKRRIKKKYREMFFELEKLAVAISAKTGLRFQKIVPTSSVRIWGSFNTKGEMKLNVKLSIIPKDLAAYVICHELCHGLHMNHSPKFWNAVTKVCPNYKTMKKELDQFSFVLKAKF